VCVCVCVCVWGGGQALEGVVVVIAQPDPSQPAHPTPQAAFYAVAGALVVAADNLAPGPATDEVRAPVNLIGFKNVDTLCLHCPRSFRADRGAENH
jgi:hypothetical protein